MKYLIFGATCEIGIGLIKEIINKDDDPSFIISSSSEDRLKSLEELLDQRNINYRTLILDFNKFDIEKILFLKDLKINYIYFFSAFTELENGKVSYEYLVKSLNINSTSILKITNFLLETIKENVYSVNFISSIAAGTNKKRNYIYSSSKIMVEHYFKSLMHYFEYSKPYIKIYRLGILSNKNQKNKFLSTKCELVSKFLYKCQNSKKSKMYYFPRKWSLLIFIISLIPKFLMKKINF